MLGKSLLDLSGERLCRATVVQGYAKLEHAHKGRTVISYVRQMVLGQNNDC